MGQVRHHIGWILAALVLTGCGSREVILSGTREDIRGAASTAQANLSAPIRLPRQVVTADWPQRAANASHVMPHAALSPNPAPLWAVSIGQGNGARHRITGVPVSDGRRVFAVDSRATVTAVSTSGAIIWQRDLTPTSDKTDDASGGGLAILGSTLFVTTGFGELHALDATTGEQRWVQQLDAAVTGAPTVAAGQVYVSTRGGEGWAIDAGNGRLRWRIGGAPSASGVTGGAAPAVGTTFAIFPFSSGQVAAAYRREGFAAWQSSVTGGRLGLAYADILDVTGDPVISGSRVYVGNPGGRIVALNAEDGNRIWTSDTGALGPVVLAGGSIFSVSDRAELVRLDAATGRRIWAAPLPGTVPVDNDRRRRDIYANYGPLLAGGRVWTTSGDGFARSFDPVTGSLAGQVALGAGAATQPIVVGSVMYVLTDDGMLRAFR